MTENQLREVLSSPYNKQKWTNLLHAVFPEVDVFAKSESVHFDQKYKTDIADSIDRIAEVVLKDATVSFYEVHIKDGVKLSKNRVGVRKLIEDYIITGLVDAALVVFKGNDPTWRFTYVTKEFDEATFKDIDVRDRKRYTYILGNGERVKTPAARLFHLAKETPKEKRHLNEAFSVETLSKTFFNEYREHYQNFVQFLTGKRMVKEKGKWKEVKLSSPNSSFVPVFGGDDKKARDFCKKLMGRITFLYFVQKKGWLGASTKEFKDGNRDFIRWCFDNCKDKGIFYNEWLRPLFFKALNEEREGSDFKLPNSTTTKIPFLNGGLFEEDDVDKKAVQIVFPSSLFSNDRKEYEQERGFLDFLDAFNFTIDEDSSKEQMVAVDPEMLGVIFENLLEDNKDKGAFYTPKPIVHFMCQETLTNYLLTSFRSKNLINSDQEEEFRGYFEDLVKKQEGAKLIDFEEELLLSLKNVKICDPAIGSGAFPVGILQEMVDIIEVFASVSDLAKSIWDLDTDEWNPAKIKIDIIQNSIYGVDTDPGAVDIARLRFWLSIIVDEDLPKPLPNLEYKIVTGNALLGKFKNEVIDIDWEVKGGNDLEKRIKDISRKITERQADFYRSTKGKEKIQQDIRSLKIELLLAQLDADKDKVGQSLRRQVSLFEDDQVKKAGLKVREAGFTKTIEKLKAIKKDASRHLPYFDWRLDFPEVMNPHVKANPGFDIVIANPPYMRVQELERLYPADKKFLEEKFENAKGAYDLANLFFELAVDLSNNHCSNCFIFPHKFFNAASSGVFRDYLLKGRYIDKIAHFGANMVFNEADTYTCISFFSKLPNEGFKIQKFPFKSDFISLMQDESQYSFVSYDKLKSASKSYGTNQFILFDAAIQYDVFTKMYLASKKLEDVFEDVFQGIATSKDDLYFLHNSSVDGEFIVGYNELADTEYKVERQFFKPILMGKNVHRYKKLSTSTYVFFPYIVDGKKAKPVLLDELKKNYPLTYAFVKDNEKAFKARERGKAESMDCWYAYIYPKNLTKFEQPKLSSMEICSDHPNVTLNFENLYHNTKVYSWVKRKHVETSYEYFLAISNSQLFWWFLLNTGDTLQGDARTFKTNYINPFPLPERVPQATDDLFKSKVEEVMELKAAGKDTKKLEKVIDSMVYKLYNLTYEEVTAIDGEFEFSEHEYQNLKLQ